MSTLYLCLKKRSFLKGIHHGFKHKKQDGAIQESNRGKVEWLISEWTKVESGQRELLFKRAGTTLFRAAPGSEDHLIIRHVAGTAFGVELVQAFGGRNCRRQYGFLSIRSRCRILKDC